jgi:hypothetical protein
VADEEPQAALTGLEKMELSVHHVDGPCRLNRVYGPLVEQLPISGGVTSFWMRGARAQHEGMKVTFQDFGPAGDDGWFGGRVVLELDDGCLVGLPRPVLYYALPCDVPMTALFASPYYGRWALAMRSMMTPKGLDALQAGS